MARYEALICDKDTISAAMSFFGDNWNKNHIMANSMEFVDYFFYNKSNGRYNIICAYNIETNEIAGLIAFTTASFFDSGIPPENDFVWITNWLVNEKARGIAGILLYTKMCGILKCKSIGALGPNKTAESIYLKMKYKTGRLNHYFIINESEKIREAVAFYEIDANQIKQLEAYNLSLPYKTAQFIINKYLKSPHYKYYAYGVADGGVLRCAIIFKIQERCGGCCIRIVELFGEVNAISGKKGQFQRLLNEFNAEYVDFYCYGIPDSVLVSSGFRRNDGAINLKARSNFKILSKGENGLIIPNYFEPFLNENIDITFAYKMHAEAENFIIYKGDGDREYPRSKSNN